MRAWIQLTAAAWSWIEPVVSLRIMHIMLNNMLSRAARAAVKRGERPRKETAIRGHGHVDAEQAVAGPSRPRPAGLVKGVRDNRGGNFRRLWKQRVGPALSPAAVGEIVHRRARLAGMEGNFGGHSLRSGFVTEASRQGVSLPAIMALTEHRAVSSVVRYFQAGSATANPAARLLEDV